MNMERQRTAKRWTEAESKLLDAIARKHGKNGVVDLNRVPLDMWPQNRSVGAACFQLNRIGYGTTGFDAEQRKLKPGEIFTNRTGGKMQDTKRKKPVARPAKPATTKTTTTWLWGLYTKTVER